MTVLRLSHDNAEVTIDLGRTSNLPNILRKTRGGLCTIYLQNRKIVGDSVCEVVNDIPMRNLNPLPVTVVNRSYDQLQIVVIKVV